MVGFPKSHETNYSLFMYSQTGRVVSALNVTSVTILALKILILEIKMED